MPASGPRWEVSCASVTLRNFYVVNDEDYDFVACAQLGLVITNHVREFCYSFD